MTKIFVACYNFETAGNIIIIMWTYDIILPAFRYVCIGTRMCVCEFIFFSRGLSKRLFWRWPDFLFFVEFTL